jgi:hypothetical protein
MNNRFIALLLLLALVTTGCYFPISGRVIDAETQQPIEGAVVLVEWDEEHGLGFTYHTIYKIAETETNKEGKFSLPGAYSPLVDSPSLLIYKQGYVAWRNDTIFPSFEKRKDYDVWQYSYVYKLERFKEGDSRFKHSMFMHTGFGGASYERTPRFEDATTFENKAARPEVEQYRKEYGRGRP